MNLQSTNYKLQTTEAGVTLLLATLILAGLTLAALAIGAFAIQELRSSRAVAVAEPAIAAAETAGEQGLWAIKRSTSFSTCPSATSQTLGNSALVNSCKSYGVATFNLKASTPFTFYLYDPNNVNGDIDLLAYPYNSMTVTHRAGSFAVTVNMSRLDGSTTGLGIQPVTVAPGNTQNITIQPVSPGSEGRIKVVLNSTGDAVVDVNTNQGMPNFPTVDATGCNSRTQISDCNSASQEIYSRRLNITVPQ